MDYFKISAFSENLELPSGFQKYSICPYLTFMHLLIYTLWLSSELVYWTTHPEVERIQPAKWAKIFHCSLFKHFIVICCNKSVFCCYHFSEKQCIMVEFM